MNYETLIKLEVSGDAQIIAIAYDGSCQLWEVAGGERYVVLCDNTVITQEEDNEDDPIFPVDDYRRLKVVK